MRADTREYLYVPVTSDEEGVEDNVIEVSVHVHGANPNWQVAEHVPGGARLLVGTGTGTPLVSGYYHRVLVRVQDNPEVPVLSVGPIFVE